MWNVLLYLGTQLERLHQFKNVKFVLQILDQKQVSGWTFQKEDLGLLLHIQQKILNGRTTVPWFSGLFTDIYANMCVWKMMMSLSAADLSDI